MHAFAKSKYNAIQQASMLIALVQRRDTIVLVQLATIPRIANPIAVIVHDPGILL